jgi:hypothetical protein
MSQCQFVLHKSYKDCSGIETGPLDWGRRLNALATERRWLPRIELRTSDLQSVDYSLYGEGQHWLSISSARDRAAVVKCMHRPHVANGWGDNVPVVKHSKCQPSARLPTAHWLLEYRRHVSHCEDGDDTTASALFVLMISAWNLHIERADCQAVCRTDNGFAGPGLRAAFVGVG